jgi:hypothetical protein
MSREAMKLALEALETPRMSYTEDGCDIALGKRVKAITALRTAIAKAEKQEPVAWMHTTGTGHVYFRKKPQDKVFSPQPVYTAPPKREWVGLTADEIWKCNKAKSGSAVEFHICYAHQNLLDFAESIESKLREKNGG